MKNGIGLLKLHILRTHSFFNFITDERATKIIVTIALHDFFTAMFISCFINEIDIICRGYIYLIIESYNYHNYPCNIYSIIMQQCDVSLIIFVGIDNELSFNSKTQLVKVFQRVSSDVQGFRGVKFSGYRLQPLGRFIYKF